MIRHVHTRWELTFAPALPATSVLHSTARHAHDSSRLSRKTDSWDSYIPGSLSQRRQSLKQQTLRSARTYMAAAKISDVDPAEPLKFATYKTPEGASLVGVVQDNAIWPLHECCEVAGEINMVEFIEQWPLLAGRLQIRGQGTPIQNVELQAPIPRPTTIMCIGKNYVEHVKEVDQWKTAPGITLPSTPKHPIVFTKAAASVVGPGADIVYPRGISNQVDYEAEVAVVIGKAGKNISAENAWDHVFGYTIVNDVTARDLQKLHQQWFLGKSCDTFCPMGPYIVPSSQIDGANLHIQCWVDDELRQDGWTSDLIFSIPSLISTISAGTTLQVGDIIATGTPAGVGSGFTPPRHLEPGQTVRISVEGIGELHNTVV